MSFQGWLSKRNTPQGGSLTRRYSVLCGTLLLDYNDESHYRNGRPPVTEAEVIGVSPWHGKGRSHTYEHGFVYVTRLGGTYYCACESSQSRDAWMAYMRRGLETSLDKREDDPTSTPPSASPARAGQPVPPSPPRPPQSQSQRSSSLHRGTMEPPEPLLSEICMKSGQPFGMTTSARHCTSCGAMCVSAYCDKDTPLPHHGSEAAVKVCDDCFGAQQLLLHLRVVCGIFEAHLHEHRRARMGDRAAVAKIMRVPNAATKFHSSSLQTGLDLLEKGKISRDDFSELVKAEQRFQRDEAANSVHAKRVEAMGLAREADGGGGGSMSTESVLRLIKLLHDSAQNDSFNVHEFYFIVQALHDLASRDLDVIDFFWPQVVHTHYLLVPAPTFEGVLKVELLEDFMLALCLKSAHLAVKLIWWLRGYLDDVTRRGKPLDADGDGCGKQVYLTRLALEVEDTVLTAGAAEAAAIAAAAGSGGSSGGSVVGHVQRRSFAAAAAALAGGSGSMSEGIEVSGHLERRVFRSLLKPTGAQSSLIADQLLLLQQLRRAVSDEFCITYRAKLKMLGSDTRPVTPPPSLPSSLPPTPPPPSFNNGAPNGTAASTNSSPATVVATAAGTGGGAGSLQAARYFEEQLAFSEALTDIAERLRFVQPVANRAAHLRMELAVLEGEEPDAASVAAAGGVLPPTAAAAAAKGSNGKKRRMPGYLPVFRAADPICPIVRIPVAEGHVFKTKERAPTLIVCEVIAPEPPDDGDDLGSVDSDDSGFGGHFPHSRSESEASVGGGREHSAHTPGGAGSGGADAARPNSWRSAAADVEQLIDSHVGERAGVLQQQQQQRNGEPSGSERSKTLAGGAGASAPWPPPGPSATMYVEVSLALQMDKLLVAENGEAAARLSAPRGALAAVVGDVKAAAARNAAAAAAAAAGGQARAETSPRAGTGKSAPTSPRSAAGAAATSQGAEKAKAGSFLLGATFPLSSVTAEGRRQRRQALASPPPTEAAASKAGKGKSGVNRRSMEGLSSLSPLRSFKRDGNKSASSRPGSIIMGGGSTAAASSSGPSGSGDSSLEGSSKHASFEDVFDILQKQSGHGMAKHLGNSGTGRSAGSGGAAFDSSGASDSGNAAGGASALGGSSGSHSLSESARSGGGGGGGGGQEESDAVAQARDLFAKGVITGEELAAVIKKDREFNEAVEEHAILDVQMCVAQAFGESWESKRARIQAASPVGNTPGWELVSIIVKSNDDLRQEVCALQLIELCRRIFAEAGRDLWLQPYLIVSTGNNMGLLQTLTNTASIDSLKKKPGFVNLARHFEAAYGRGGAKSVRLAQRNFVVSLAAYSLVCYVLQIKDRHNGNMLLDTEGHIVHIDFGFMLGIAPGGAFSLESSPFKLTVEMVEVMGGLDSELFRDFVIEFTCGFLALQQKRERIVTLVEMLTRKSPFPCFQDKDTATILQRLNQRLAPGLDMAATVDHCLDLIQDSYDSAGTRQYDTFQFYTNGIQF